MMNFFKDESGQGMVEYGLIIALIAIAVIVIYHTIKLPEEFKSLWDKLFYVGFTFFLFYFLIVYLVGKAFDYFLLKSVY